MMRHDAPEYYYHTRVKRGPSGLHDTWLILGGEAFDNHTVPDDEKLSLSLTGTNGQLPRRALQSTLLDTVVKSTASRIRVRNLCAPTPALLSAGPGPFSLAGAEPPWQQFPVDDGQR